MARILVVEDEEQLCKLIAKWLKGEHHVVEICGNGTDAVNVLAVDHFDALILDIMLPGVDGFEVCRRFRKDGGMTPILMLTAKRSIADKEMGLDCGADDYLTKPFKLRELSARIRALLRRQPVVLPSVLEVGELVLDSKTNRVYRGDQELKLMPKEFNLLEVLMKQGGNLVRTEYLTASVWGPSSKISSETVRSYMRLLRQKIDKPGEESLIETVHGVGYRLGSPDVQ